MKLFFKKVLCDISIVFGIAVVLGIFIFSIMCLDIDGKYAERNKEYLVTATVYSVDLEGFSEGVYYYKVMYSYERNDEIIQIGELIKTSSVYEPYKIGEEIECYIDYNNEFLSSNHKILFRKFVLYILCVVSACIGLSLLVSIVLFIVSFFKLLIALIKKEDLHEVKTLYKEYEEL